jgi:N-acylglucosamine 2-epimerase
LAKALMAAKELMGEKAFKEKAEALIHELTKHFWEPRANILLENVFPEGGYSDCLRGRQIHAGRVFEAFNAFYDLTKELNKRQLRRQLAQHVAFLAETTWDEAHGGYFYWLDLKSSANGRTRSQLTNMPGCSWKPVRLYCGPIRYCRTALY